MHLTLKNPYKLFIMQFKSKFQRIGLYYNLIQRKFNNPRFLQIVFILTTFSIICPKQSHAQWLQDLRANHYNSLTVQYWKAQEIKETAISYKNGVKETTQTQITFSVDRKQINQSVTKEGIKVESNLYSFNPRKQILAKTLRKSSNGTNWSFERYTYSYQANLLTSVNSLKITGELIYFLVVKSDSLGFPIKVEQFTPDSILMASEICIFNRSKNRVTYQLMDAGGRVVSTTEGRIAVKSTGKERYNLHGDCYFYPKSDNPSDNIFFSVEFEYDSNGNWTEKRVFEGQLNSPGELTDSILVMEYKRKIKYIRQD